MRMKILFFLLCLLTVSCKQDKMMVSLNDFTKNYQISSKNYKVICFLPADGCSSCIDPTLNYVQNANEEFLMVLSYYENKESMNGILASKNINRSTVLIDTDHLAIKNFLVTPIAPCFYFLRKGRVIKKVDLTDTYDKTSVLKEVEEYIANK